MGLSETDKVPLSLNIENSFVFTDFSDF